MKELSTIQKVKKLNNVFAVDEPGPGGAHHYYFIEWQESAPGVLSTGKHYPRRGRLEIKFQKGTRKDPESTHGVLDSDLLEIVRDRLKAFQAGEFACRENALALTHIEEALILRRRLCG